MRNLPNVSSVRIATLACVVAVLAICGSVPAHAASVDRIDCDRDGCLVGIPALTSWTGTAKLRVDVFPAAGANKPSINRMVTRKNRRGNAWVYRANSGWRKISIRDMRVRVAPAPWEGWSKIRRSRPGAQWMYVRSSEHAVELSCRRVNVMSAQTGQSCHRSACWGPRPQAHVASRAIASSAFGCVAGPGTTLPTMSRADLLSGKGAIVASASWDFTDASWTQAQATLAGLNNYVTETNLDGYDVRRETGDGDPASLICSLSLVGQHGYSFDSDADLGIISDTSGTPMIAVTDGSMNSLVLVNRPHGEGNYDLVLRCGLTSAPASGDSTEIDGALNVTYDNA